MKSYLGNGCYVEWKLKDGTFSASGEIWNKMGTDLESGGQNLDELVEMFQDDEQLFLLHRIWKRYHLNDMRPGSPIQTRLVREEIEPLYYELRPPLTYYEFCCQELEKRGRLRDPDYIIDGVAYKYGSKWLKEELPEEVVEEINSWTETERTTLTLAEQFVEDNDCVVKYVEFKDNMNWYKLTVNDKVDFDFQAGTAHTDVDAVQIINCLLDEARDSSQGLDYCLDYCDDLGYSGKESIRIANALVENWEKMCEVGLNLLFDDEED